MQRFILLLAALLLVAAPLFAEVKLEIGPDTTVIDGPVNPDGTINYLAYLNQKLSEGITPENNFAVDVALSMGQEAWHDESYRQRMLTALGVDAPNDDFVISPSDLRSEVWDAITSRPWDADEYPEAKTWLDHHSAALDRIQPHADQKDRFYFPLMVNEGMPESIDTAPRPWVNHMRAICRGFLSRAESRIANGNIDGAWSDVLTIYHIAALSAKEPYVTSWMAGLSNQYMAASVVEDLVASERFTGGHARRMTSDLDLLDKISAYEQAYESGDRYTSLDYFMRYWRSRGTQSSESDEFPGYYVVPPRYYFFMDAPLYDPNVTMHAVNDFGKRWIDAGRISNYREQTAAIELLERLIGTQYQQALRLLDGDPDEPHQKGRFALNRSELTSVVTSLILKDVFDNRNAINLIEARCRMRFSLTPVALAIGGYHAENGAYPPDLHALVPAYLDSLPTDFATGELPVYKVEGGAAIVYSLGTDLEDDGGVDDLNEGDIVFRIQR